MSFSFLYPSPSVEITMDKRREERKYNIEIQGSYEIKAKKGKHVPYFYQTSYSLLAIRSQLDVSLKLSDLTTTF
jgi:hypothetical protein